MVDSGNLRVETDGMSTTNVHMVNSHLVSCQINFDQRQLKEV
jgi:hypothetical protein